MRPDGLTARGWLWCAWLLSGTEECIANANNHRWTPSVRWEAQADRLRARLLRIEARARREAER